MLSPKLPTGVSYCLTMTVASSTSDLNYTEFYLDKDLKVTRKYNIQNGGTSRTVNAVFTLNDNECYIAIELGCSSSATIVFDSPMLNLGSTAMAYTPYNGQTATVNFGQSVTIGGFIDLTNGKVTLTDDTEISVTPVTVSSIVGANNIFLDTGNLTQIAYFENAEDNLIKLIKAYQI